MNGWYSTVRRMNFIKFIVTKRLSECLPSVINVFLNTGEKIRGWEGEVCDGEHT